MIIKSIDGYTGIINLIRPPTLQVYRKIAYKPICKKVNKTISKPNFLFSLNRLYAPMMSANRITARENNEIGNHRLEARALIPLVRFMKLKKPWLALRANIL